MRGGCHDVRIVEGGVVDFGCDQAGNVRHVDDQVAADFVRDRAHALVVDGAAVGACPCHEHFRAVHERVLFQLVVVDDACLEVDAVREGLEVGADSTDLLRRGLVAVAQVAAVGEIEAHEAVVGPHDGLVDLEVCWGAGEGLHVDAPGLGVEVEGFEGALLAEQFDLVDVFVAAVVACAGVSFAVFVAHGRAESVEDGSRGDVLGGDEEDGLALPLDLFGHDFLDLGVGVVEGFLHQVGVGLREGVCAFGFPIGVAVGD